MKAFISSVIFVLAVAVAAGVLFESTLSVSADQAFSGESVRVGEAGSIEHRRFSGQ